MKILIALLMTIFITGCSLMPPSGRAYLNPMDLERKKKELKDKELKQKKLVGDYDKESNITKKKKILIEYIDTTININRKSCFNHLRLAAFNNTHRNFYKSEIASTGIFTATILGATKVSPLTIAATASIFAFLENSIENYDNSYKVNSEELMIDLVKSKYTQMEFDIWSKSASAYNKIDAIINIERADIVLDEHQYLCTFEGLMSLVRETIEDQSKKIIIDARKKHNIK